MFAVTCWRVSLRFKVFNLSARLMVHELPPSTKERLIWLILSVPVNVNHIKFEDSILILFYKLLDSANPLT